MKDIDSLIEAYFKPAKNKSSATLLELIEEVLNEEDSVTSQSPEKVVENKKAPRGRFSYTIPIPAFTPSEAWGDPGSQDRKEINKLFRSVSGGENIQARIQSVNSFLSPKSAARKRSPSAIINMMMVVEALQATLNDYNESASGFVFEGFMAALTGGKQIAGKVAGTLPIEDFVAFSEFGSDLPVSLKLLGPKTPVKGSFTNIVDFLLVRGKPSIKYLVAYKLAKGEKVQKLELFAFDITIRNFIKFIVGTNGTKLLGKYNTQELEGLMNQYADDPDKKTLLPQLAKIFTEMPGYHRGLLHGFLKTGELPKAKTPEEEAEEEERIYRSREKKFGALSTRYAKRQAKLAQQANVQERLEESINRGDINITISEAFHYIEKQTLLTEGSTSQWEASHPQLVALSTDLNLERFGQIDLSQENIDELAEIYSEKLEGGILTLLEKAKDLTANIGEYYGNKRRSTAQAAGNRAKDDANVIKNVLEEDPRYKK